MHYKRKALQRRRIARQTTINRKNEKKNKIVEKLRADVKKEEEYIDMCKEKGKSINYVDDINISFEPLDVSAKTINSNIILNERLLDAPWVDQMRYIIHELTHCAQQDNGEVHEKTNKSDYLDDENEQEAFQAQISFMSEHNSPREIQEYIENLLDHHDITGKERKEKAEKLTEGVE